MREILQFSTWAQPAKASGQKDVHNRRAVEIADYLYEGAEAVRDAYSTKMVHSAQSSSEATILLRSNIRDL